MAVGLMEPEKLLPVAGLKLATLAAGIRYQNRDDLLLVELSKQTQTAAVFTTNAFCAAPVVIAKQHLIESQSRYLLINAGNANAGTGQAGIETARQCCQMAADSFNVNPNQVLPFSTGVIGEQLPLAAFSDNISQLTNRLDEKNWLPAAKAIMTTDTVAKGYSKQVMIDGKAVTITGISKGSGMICPNMATMLAFIGTDAEINSNELQHCLHAAVAVSFNRITVDGDTSTNDACVLMASGASGLKVDTQEHMDTFLEGLKDVCIWLAQAIIRDGEGASKFITLKVGQANSDDEASSVAYTIAHSPLVKTALFASDPNWGRILAAVGRAPVDALEIEKADIYLGDVCVIRRGEPASEYMEESGKAVFEKNEIELTVLLGRGNHSTTVWTTDLSHDYVSINADYRS